MPILRSSRTLCWVGLVFSSSVVVYGNTQDLDAPIRTDAPLQGVGAYAESKIAAETAIAVSGRNSVILRISGVSVPDFLLPPDRWPFTSDQRMEFVQVADVAAALTSAATVDFEPGLGKDKDKGKGSGKGSGKVWPTPTEAQQQGAQQQMTGQGQQQPRHDSEGNQSSRRGHHKGSFPSDMCIHGPCCQEGQGAADPKG